MPFRRRVAVPVLAVAIGLTLTAGVATAVVRRPVATSPQAAGPLPQPVAAETPRPVVTDLGMLLASPGPSYRRVPSGPGRGPLDSRQFLALAAGDTATERAFAALGFRRGYAASWLTNRSRQEFATFVFEFSADDGAARYARGIRGAATQLGKPVPFRVAGLPEYGLADAQPDKDGRYVQLVVVHRGPRAALVVCFATAPAPQADLMKLAQRQYALL